MEQSRLTMARTASVFIFMVLLAVIVEGREWRFEASKRVKRGYNNGGFGTGNDSYGRSDDQNASVSRERLGCSGEQGGESYGSGSRELSYNRDGRSNDQRRNRSFNKASASASASATALNMNHKTNL